MVQQDDKGKHRDTKDRYHKMVDEIEDYAIIFLDNDGIIQNWNRGAEKIKQYREVEAVGMHFQMFYLPEDRAVNLPHKLLNNARIEGKAIHEGWRLRKDQTRFWGSITLTALHDENGNVIGFSKVTRDLTEKKIAEDQLRAVARELQQSNEALRKSEERFHRMISEVQDYAIILLDPQGNIQNWNTGAEKIKGYSSTEIIGKNFRLFYLPEDQEHNLPEKLIGIAASEGRATHEGWRLRKNGSRFWGNIVITALHDENGEIIGYSKVTRDLTERKFAEDKLKKYLKELEKQNKELEEFAFVASHDLQEPLRKIQTFTDLILENFEDQGLVKNYFQKIILSAERMRELIISVLNYSKLLKEDTHKVDTDLREILDKVIVDFEFLIKEKQARIIADNLHSAEVIPSQIGQLFSNMLSNSIKFSETKPVIRINSEVVSSETIKHFPDYLAKGSYLQVVFSDNGIGFDQEYEHLIFSMFQRLHTKHKYSGTGIGLALCKKIMENHHGFINAQSEVGKGATFFLYFPV